MLITCLQHELDGVTFAIVVALTDENDDELEPMEAGPDSVVHFSLQETCAAVFANQSQVFNHRVYQKSWMTDPVRF
jgi:hypothetical protein